ncbi:hypothetical protein C8J57DRAFT_1558005 [Mycena rebaudengoi]|nr:hypothetical protein C8J57DRAFT_1558005 [Mycena rebaudengoi]
MSPSGVAHYDEELKYLARLLRALPEAIPLGDCHDFIGYLPDPRKFAVAGCTQTVVSHALAASFNRSTGSAVPIIFQSRGTELEEVTTVLRRYITGNAGSNVLLVSWVDDLTTAATSAITTAGIPLPRKVNITAAKRLMEDSALVENAKKRKRSDDQAAKDAQKEHTEEAKKRTEQGQLAVWSQSKSTIIPKSPFLGLFRTSPTQSYFYGLTLTLRLANAQLKNQEQQPSLRAGEAKESS